MKCIMFLKSSIHSWKQGISLNLQPSNLVLYYYGIATLGSKDSCYSPDGSVCWQTRMPVSSACCGSRNSTVRWRTFTLPSPRRPPPSTRGLRMLKKILPTQFVATRSKKSRCVSSCILVYCAVNLTHDVDKLMNLGKSVKARLTWMIYFG